VKAFIFAHSHPGGSRMT